MLLNLFSPEDDDDKDSENNSSEDGENSGNEKPPKKKKPVKKLELPPPEINLSSKAMKQLETLMLEGDLLEVTMDETQHIWRILQATEPRRSKKYPGKYRVDLFDQFPSVMLRGKTVIGFVKKNTLLLPIWFRHF